MITQQSILISRRTEPLMTLDGINIFIALISEYLIESGFDVSVVGIGEVDRLKYQDSFGVTSLPTFLEASKKHSNSILNEVCFGVGLYRHLRNRNWDLVLQNGITFFSGPKRNMLLCHDWEGTFWNRKVQLVVQKVIYSRTRYLIAATSTEIQKKLSEFVKREVAILPTCVKIKKSHQIKNLEERYRITHIGTQHYKNPLKSLDIFQSIFDGKMVLTFIGRKTDYLNAAINELPDEMRSHIEFYSNLPRDTYMELIAESLFCSIPSSYSVGVLSPTCLDAFVNATPVFASGLSSDLFKCGLNGLCVENCCYEKMPSRDVWQSMSRNALETAKRFDVKNVGQIILSLFAASDNS